MNNEIKNYGFIEPKIELEDYVFGGGNVVADVFQENGQWDQFVPKDEIQENESIETSNCTGYGTLNCLETFMKRAFGENNDYSERYTGVMAGTRPPGNSPQTVIQSIRKIGVIPESVLPFDQSITSIEEYYSPDPMIKHFTDMGMKWLEGYDVFHEWVSPYIADMKEALKYSPLGVGVYAWVQNTDGIYIRVPGGQDNHWCMCYGYEDGKYWKIFDSYDSTHKKLDWNFGFSFIKRYHIDKKKIIQPDPKQKQILLLLQKIIELYQVIINQLSKVGSKIFKK